MILQQALQFYPTERKAMEKIKEHQRLDFWMKNKAIKRDEIHHSTPNPRKSHNTTWAQMNNATKNSCWNRISTKKINFQKIPPQKQRLEFRNKPSLTSAWSAELEDLSLLEGREFAAMELVACSCISLQIMETQPRNTQEKENIKSVLERECRVRVDDSAV